VDPVNDEILVPITPNELLVFARDATGDMQSFAAKKRNGTYRYFSDLSAKGLDHRCGGTTDSST
jgi:hypothetical protein